MSFNSYVFILIFLPITLGLFYLSAKLKSEKINTLLLILESIFFYVYSGKIMVLYLLLTIILNYVFYTYLKRSKNLIVLSLAIIINLLPLFVCKYLNFSVGIVNRLFGSSIELSREILVPLGISFITFQQIAFLVDVYHNDLVEIEFLDYSLFVSNFAHIPSGPILTHENYLLKQTDIATVNWNNIASGLYLFSVGLAKKVLLADRLALAVNAGYNSIDELNRLSSIYIVLAYTLQIYFDFSGYCDMATGVARMINIYLPQNFNSPYLATNISDFWKRWHMTLTSFLTKYIYIPLGGSRRGIARMIINTMIVFLVSGLWHGASFTFIIWGALHGIGILITKLLKAITNRKYKMQAYKYFISGVGWILTFIFVNVSWIFFRADRLVDVINIGKSLVRVNGGINDNIVNVFDNLRSFNIISNWSKESMAWIFIFICFIISVYPRNAYTKVSCEFKASLLDGIVTVGLLVISVCSMTNVVTYIYAMF